MSSNRRRSGKKQSDTAKEAVPATPGATRIIFLGGVGEVGRNMTLFEHDGRILVVDAGLMFPSEEMLGVDLVLPDTTYLKERADQIEGIFLTHGHEDHIGGLPFLLRDINPPIYGAALTLGILRAKLEEHRLLAGAELHEVKDKESLKLGPFNLSFFHMAHSIPDTLAVMIATPAGRLFYTGDYKIDNEPVSGPPTDTAHLASVAGGVEVMLGDSTNAEQPGHTPSESTVGKALLDVIGGSAGRVIVACFASNIHRMQQVVTAALQCDRMVAFLGRSMVNNMEVARRLGHLKVPDSMLVPIDKTDSYPPERIVIISTGSQGEPLSALSLMAAREHRWIKLEEGDTVVLSASPVPGNESAVRRVINGLSRIGVRVMAPPAYSVHVSGHASAGDLQDMLKVIRPQWLIPCHGEHRMLATHIRLAEEIGLPANRTILPEDGDVLELFEGELKRVDRIDAGYVFVDGLGIGDVRDVVLRDRRLLADDGVIVCVVTIDAQTGELLAGPDVITRGFVYEDQASEFLEDAKDEIYDALEALADDEITDWAAIRRAVRKSLGKFVWKRTGRRPIILPVVMEV